MKKGPKLCRFSKPLEKPPLSPLFNGGWSRNFLPLAGECETPVYGLRQVTRECVEIYCKLGYERCELYRESIKMLGEGRLLQRLPRQREMQDACAAHIESINGRIVKVFHDQIQVAVPVPGIKKETGPGLSMRRFKMKADLLTFLDRAKIYLLKPIFIDGSLEFRGSDQAYKRGIATLPPLPHRYKKDYHNKPHRQESVRRQTHREYALF